MPNIDNNCDFTKKFEIIQASNLPEFGKTMLDFISDVLSTETGKRLRLGANRWDLSLEQDPNEDPKINQALTEQHKQDWTIKPRFFLTPGVERSLEEEPVSDADPVGHLQVVYYLLRDILFQNTISTDPKIEELRELLGKNTNRFYRTMAYITAFHDYHEGQCGDEVGKTKPFKLGELVYIYNYTCADLITAYNKQIDASKSLINQQKDELKSENLACIKTAFLTFCREGKLAEKYNITSKDIIAIFNGKYEEISGINEQDIQWLKDQNWQEYQHIFGENIEDLVTQAYVNTDIYAKMADFYEELHDMSFLLAALSAIGDSPKTLALQHQVLQNCLPHLLRPKQANINYSFTCPLKYQEKFLIQNRETIIDILLKLNQYNRKNPNTTTNKILQEEGRSCNASLIDLLRFTARIPESLLQIKQLN